MGLCPSGEIGIHVCLRSICRKACWFKSSLGHHLFELKASILAFFLARSSKRCTSQEENTYWLLIISFLFCCNAAEKIGADEDYQIYDNYGGPGRGISQI